MRARVLAACSCLILLLSCHSPTEPTETYMFVAEGGTFSAVDGSRTILACEPSLDGRAAGSGPQLTDPASAVYVSAALVDVARGHHVLGLRLTSDPPASIPYRVSGITVGLYESRGWGSWKTVSTLQLPDQTASLASGESLKIPFDL